MSVVSSTQFSLDELAVSLLTVCEDALLGTSEGVPDIVFHSIGPPPMDCCDMLALHIPSLTPETTSPTGPAAATGRQVSYGRINLASLYVTILRCVPTITNAGPPSVGEMNAKAAIIREDGWTLWNAVYQAIKAGEFKDTCSDVHLDRMVAVAEQGGCAGWQLQLRAELYGIPTP